MTDSNSNEDMAMQLDVEFFPKYGPEEENGLVQSKVALRQVAFGMEDRPNLLLEIGVNDAEDTVILKLTVGSMDLEEARDILQMASIGAGQMLEQQQMEARRASADLN